MKLGKSIASLAAIFDYREVQLKQAISKLAFFADREITPTDLKGFVPDSQEYLTFNCLVTCGAIELNSSRSYSGKLNLKLLERLEEYLIIFLEAIEGVKKPSDIEPSHVELAWTIPLGISINDQLPPRISLVALIKYVISLAKHRLYMVSPFLDETATEILSGPIDGAARRGVEIFLISHGLDDKNSPGYHALHAYREITSNIRAFSAPTAKNGTNYLLLHAKLVVADNHNAVLSSANLTQYGLMSHLEIGVGVQGQTAADIESLILNLISSNLVKEMTP